jgi:hypothetical protein
LALSLGGRSVINIAQVLLTPTQSVKA